MIQLLKLTGKKRYKKIRLYWLNSMSLQEQVLDMEYWRIQQEIKWKYFLNIPVWRISYVTYSHNEMTTKPNDSEHSILKAYY